MEVKCESERETMEPEREKEIADEENESPVEEYNPLNIVKEMLEVDEQYRPLLTLLEQLSLPQQEDIMQYYRKLRHFENSVHSMCPDETQLNQAFATFRAAALLNSKTARKLAAAGASFSRDPQQQQLRAALLTVVMQGTFSKLDALKRTDPMFLINAVILMGDYFALTRKFNVNNLEVLALASPLLQYVRALLGIDDVRAHRCVASQMKKNGREFQLRLPQEVAELKSLLGRYVPRG